MPKRSFDVAFKLHVVNFAEHSNNEATARKFQIDSKQVRTWRQQKGELEKIKGAAGGKTRKNLPGQGRKLISEQQMEEQLYVNQKAIKSEEGTKKNEKFNDVVEAPLERKDGNDESIPPQAEECAKVRSRKRYLESEVKDNASSDVLIKVSPSDLEMSESDEEDKEHIDSDSDNNGSDDIKVKEELESDYYESSEDAYSSSSWNDFSDDEKKPITKVVRVKVEQNVLGNEKKAVKRKISAAKLKRPRGRPKQPRRLGAPGDYTSEEDDDEKTKKPLLPQGGRYPLEFKFKVLKYAETHSNPATADKFGLPAKRIREWKKSKSKLDGSQDSSERLSKSEEDIGDKKLQTRKRRGRPKQTRRLGAPEDYTSEEDEEKAEKPILQQGTYPVEFKLKVLKYAETHSNTATADKFGLGAKTIREWGKAKFQIEEESKGHQGPKKRRPRGDGYTVEEKLQAVAFALERTTHEASLLYNVDRTTIGTWKAEKALLEARMQNGEGSSLRRVGSGLKPRYSKIEEQLRDWIVALRLKGHVVNNRMILTKAKNLIEEDPSTPGSTVPRSVSWVAGFLKRQNLNGLIGTTLGREDPKEILNVELKTGGADMHSLVEKITEIPENPNKRHKRTINIEDKVNIIKRIEQGETQGNVAKALKVATSTIQTIWSCRTEIMYKYLNPKSKTTDAQIWKTYRVIGAALKDWVEQNSTKSVKVDYRTLMDKAVQFAQTYKLSTFNNDAKHWVRVFCKRHDLQDALIELRSNQNSIPSSASTFNNNISQNPQSQPVPLLPTRALNTTGNSDDESSRDHHDDDLHTDFVEFLSQAHNDSENRAQNHSLHLCQSSGHTPLSNTSSSHHLNQEPFHAETIGNLSSHRLPSMSTQNIAAPVISSSDAIKYIYLLRSWIHTNYGSHEEPLNNYLSAVENAVLKKRVAEMGHGS